MHVETLRAVEEVLLITLVCLFVYVKLFGQNLACVVLTQKVHQIVHFLDEVVLLALVVNQGEGIVEQLDVEL